MRSSIWSSVYEIIRPFGRRRLVSVCLVMLLQAITQFLAVFSLAPFLAAATDTALFRGSNAGQLLLGVLGDVSDFDLIMITGVVSLVSIAVSNAVGLLGDYTRARYSYALAHWTRMRVLHNVLSRRYEYFLSVNTAHLLKTLAEDVSTLVNHVVMAILDLASRAAIVLLLALVVLIVSPQVMLVAVAGLGIFVLTILKPMRRRAADSSDELLVWLRAMFKEVNQLLAGIKPVLATSRVPQFVDRVSRASRGYSSVMVRMPIYAAIPRSALEVLVFGGIIAWVMVVMATGGNLIAMLPQLGVIGLVAYRMMPLLQAITIQSMNITSSRQSLDEVLALYREQHLYADDEKPWTASDEVPGAIAWSQEIRLQEVSFTYAGAERKAIDSISLTIPKGSHVAFVGPTGSGKSTIIDMLMGLLLPTEGQILIDGRPLTAEQTPAWRRGIGYVPQDLFLYDATIAENIAFGFPREEVDDARMREVAGLARAAEFIEQPGTAGFETMVGERGVRLSGGQRQRLALARALYDGPNVLVLDEATSALDPRTEAAVVANLGQGSEKLTVISITHRLATIKHYDCIFFIRDGRIVASGSYDELQHDPHFQEFSH